MAETSVNPLAFLKEVRLEIDKVSWPKKEETIRLTAIVLAISTLVGLYVGGLDFLFTKITQLLLIR